MINFKLIELSDKPQIDGCLNGNTFRTCDLCFTNLYAWNAKFKTQFDIIQKTLFLRFEDSNKQIFYMMPIGPMPLKEAIELMINDSEKANIPFRLKYITQDMWNMIKVAMPAKFEYSSDNDNDEYIYLSEKLITLSGKKLQSKRNHINRFKADHSDWEYFPLTSKKELEECVEMLDKWEESKEDIDITLRFDYIATRLMLKHFDYLELKGAAIRVNGQIVAFTIGEKLTDDTFVVHVEKAFGEINGAYTIVNQQFIEHEASTYKYINREEDMGIEALRKAKQSYQPTLMLEKAILSLTK